MSRDYGVTIMGHRRRPGIINSSRCWVAALLAALTLSKAIQVGAAPAELLVKWREGPASESARAGNALIGSKVAANFLELGWQQVILPDGMNQEAGLQRYRALSDVLAVEPNAFVGVVPDPIASPSTQGATSSALASTAPPEPGLAPNDPQFRSQWNLRKISATNAWAITTGSSNVVVAILDTGVQYTHPDLAANMWRNPGETGLDAAGHDKATNGVDDDGNGYIDDVYGIDAGSHDTDPMDEGFFGYYHGTACAGIVGAAGNNARGVAGINWQVRIMAIKCLRRPDEEFPPIASWLEGFNYVLMMKKAGVNIRATSNSYGHWPSEAWRDAVNLCTQAGILTVCAAGNVPLNGDTDLTSYPAFFDSLGVISVAASTSSDALAAFSTYGRSNVDLAAPGENITTTFVGSGGYTTQFTGTSAAAPHVAGAVALLCSARPEVTVAEIKTALLQSVDQPNAFRGKVMSNGRLNLKRALDILGKTDLPPAVIHVAPEAVLDLDHAPLTVVFSKPMDRASVEAAFSLTNRVQGVVTGSFAWSDDQRTLTFTPGQKLAALTRGFATIRSTARDATGFFLDGNFDRTAAGSANDDFQWTFRTPPANDNPSGAIALSGESGQIDGSNSGADVLGDVEYENPKAGATGIASVWYRWVAPRAGAFTFETTGTTLDTLLVVYRWNDYGQDVPEEIGSNDNFGSGRTSHVTFAADSGVAYYATVDAKTSANTGPFTLRWFPTPPPVFSAAPFGPDSTLPGGRISLRGTNFTQTTAVLIGDENVPFTPSTKLPDQQLSVTVPLDANSGPVTVMTSHGNATTPTALRVLAPPLSCVCDAAGNFQVEWRATGKGFVLEETSDLGSAKWTPVKETETIGSESTRITLPTSGRARFFRLRGN